MQKTTGDKQARTFDKTDKYIIGLNILAFLLQIFMPEGKSSIVAFSVFSMTLSVITIETYLAYGFVKNVWLSGTKLLCYMLAVVVMLIKGGQEFILTPFNIAMIVICIFGLVIRWFIRHYTVNKKAAILLYIQNIANLTGGISYCVSVVKHPQHYGIYSILFWTLNIIGYWIAVNHIMKAKGEKPNYIFPVFGLVCCALYVVTIIIMKII